MARGINKAILVGNLGNDPEIKYTGQDGVEKYFTEIVANEMQMLGGRGDGAGPRSERPAARPERSNSAPARDDGNARPAAKPDFADDFADDDIPF